MRLKQRLVRLLIRELVADVDDVRSEIVLVIHWHGGRHTELRVPKNKTGRHGHRTSDEARDIVRRMAGRWPDEQIAATLNRLGLRTGAGNTWNDHRVYMLRHDLKLPAFDPEAVDRSGVLTLGDAARKLGVSETLVRRLIGDGLIAASQVAPCAPYEIAQDALDSAAVKKAVHEARTLGRVVSARAADRRTLSLPGLDSEPMPPSRTR
jgi:plasmid stability protein